MGLQGYVRGVAAAGALALALAGCGGGAGGGGVTSTPAPAPSPSPTPTPTPAPSPTPTPPAGFVIVPETQQPVRSAQDDAEFRQNYVSFEYVNALYALDNGWTGQGVKVGVLDDGVKTVSELQGRISSLSKDFGTVTENGVTTQRNVVGDDYSDHGTMVAGVIAANNNGSGVQGMAPGAEIVALRISEVDLDATNPDDQETLGIGMTDAVAYAAAQGVKVINASIAKLDAEERSFGWSSMVADYQRSGGLFVNAAGNGGGANAVGYLDLNSSNSQSWLFVVALDPSETDYQLADYSNRCGVAAMNNCVAAMGTNATQDVDGTLVWFGGTSSATPQVSGLAALILSKWPQLSGIQAGQVIVNTARDIGDAGVDAVYGHGLIDVQAALSPVNPTLSNGVAQTSAGSATMIVPGPVGTAGFAASVLRDVTVLDAYGRDFRGDLTGLVARPGQDARWLDRRMAVQANAGFATAATGRMRAAAGFTRLRGGPGADQWQTALTSAELALRGGRTWFSLALNSRDAVMDDFMGLAPTADVVQAHSPLAGMTLGASHPLAGGMLGVAAVQGGAGQGGGKQGGTVRGAVLSWRKGNSGIKAGMLDERGALFGTPTGSGALRLGDGGRTAFVEMAQQARLGAWRLDGYASVAATRIRLADDMLLTGAGAMLSSRFGLTASRPLLGGTISLGVAQPLVVVRGNGTYTVGSGYDLASRSLRFTDRPVDFSGRIDPLLTFGFTRQRQGSQLRLALAGNASASDLRALGTWRVALH